MFDVFAADDDYDVWVALFACGHLCITSRLYTAHHRLRHKYTHYTCTFQELSISICSHQSRWCGNKPLIITHNTYYTYRLGFEVRPIEVHIIIFPLRAFITPKPFILSLLNAHNKTIPQPTRALQRVVHIITTKQKKNAQVVFGRVMRNQVLNCCSSSETGATCARSLQCFATP